jgi:holo-[acyl-carrier protein] synthase
MILGIGLDEIEVERMEVALRKEDGLKQRLFTPGEIDYCEARRHAGMFFAARFAAKEALAKALGTGIAGGVNFGDIEVVHDEGGRPSIRLHGRARHEADLRGVGRIHVSLSHTRQRATAIVILETGEGMGRHGTIREL